MDDLEAVSAAPQRSTPNARSTSQLERVRATVDDAPKKTAPGVRADEPFVEAGRRSLRFQFLRMLANEEGARQGEDVDAVHDMRVATRRQRAIFRIVAPYFKRDAVRGFRNELRTLARRLGAVRDVDVLIEAAEDYRSSSGVDTPEVLEPLIDEWRTRRMVARDDLLAHLNGGDYRAFTGRYMVFLASTGEGVKDAPGDPAPPHLVRDVLPAQVWSHYGRLRAYDTVLEHASVETIHALRIQGKRLRYLLEFSGGVLGRGRTKAIEAMVALQDHTGEIHDAEVTIGLLRDFLMRTAEAPSHQMVVADSVGRYLTLKLARLRTLQRTLKRPWRAVARKRFRKLLARAVADI